MSNERFTDELLSAIIDGEADTETVASVNESAEASARLEHMRQAVQIVGEAPLEATPQRRSASIAAAMAAASPAPEVTSLAAARHDRDVAKKKKRSLSGGWIAAVAAAVAFLIAIPIAIGLGGTDATDTATVTDAAGDSTSLADEDSAASANDAGDAADFAEDAVAGDDEAMEEEAEAIEPEEAMEDEPEEAEARDEEEAMEDEAPAATTAAEVNPIARGERLDELLNGRDLPPANNVDVLNDLVDLGTIEPRYSADDLLFTEVVNPECLQADAVNSSLTPYGLAELTPFGGADRLILVEFADDGTSRLLDAEDCAVLG